MVGQATKRNAGRREHPRLTAEQARAFRTYSGQNAAHVAAQLSCGCEPYRDVYTFNRWIAQGYVVQRGQHAVRIPVVVETKDDETDETTRSWRTAAVFCRHQVAPLKTKDAPLSDKPQERVFPEQSSTKPDGIDARIATLMGAFAEVR